MSCPIPSTESLLAAAEEAFLLRFQNEATIAAAAPGRVNLIGEHTDYNDGFVLPMALPLQTILVGRLNEDEICRVNSLSVSSGDCDTVEFDPRCPGPSTDSTQHWANYVKGVVANFHGSLPCFDAVIISSVPMGGGISSSAALEVATYTFLEALTGTTAESSKKKALACQKAEHDYAGVPCGIMDQFISTMGVQDSALLIDCRSLEAKPVPLNNPKIKIVITNSNVKHKLSGSEYPTRRKQCFEAALIMGKRSLRDASMADVESFKSSMEEVIYKRAKHVVSEINRTEAASQCLMNEDYETFGKLMNESHNSLRLDYQVSCPELDQLVDIAQSIEGVYGSRMTGGGFGGCTVTLIKEEAVDALITSVDGQYNGKASFYICSAASGASILKKQ